MKPLNERQRFTLRAIEQGRVRCDDLGSCFIDDDENVTLTVQALDRRGLVAVPRAAQGSTRLVRAIPDGEGFTW